MAYTDLRDFEPEYTTATDTGLTIRIEKMGGGTVGESYTGTWRYIITDATGREVGRGQDLTSGMAKTHAEIAEIAAEYFETEG